MIHLRNDKEIDAIRKSSQIVAGALQLAGEMIEEGMTTQRLADELEKYIVKHNARPAFKDTRDFLEVCASHSTTKLCTAFLLIGSSQRIR